jgi:hypothetical protein
VQPASAVLDGHENIEPFQHDRVHSEEVTRDHRMGLSGQKLPPRGPDLRGAGSIPAAFKISHTVEGATL